MSVKPIFISDSAIADYASVPQYVQRVAAFMESRGMEVPKMTTPPREVCIAALAS